MRSITGCGACRLRHLKCDETRPGCHLCITNGRVCPGYAPQFRWTQQLNDSRTLVSDDGEDRVFRRPLYDKSHQESMATEITESLGKKTATVALANLDAWLEDHLQAPSAQITQHFQGPFGILDPSIGQNAQNTPPTCAVNHSEHLEDSRGLLLGQTEGIAPGSDSDVEATLVINGTGSEGNTPSRTPSLGLGQATAHYSSNENYPGINTTAMHFAPQAMTPISVGETETQSMCPPIPHKAFELLQHYAESHIAPLPSLRAGPNCPWQTIQYPSAKRTYAEILLRQSASHVSLSLFFSLLAISSRHLAAINDSKEDWKKLQNLFERTTRRHLDLALRNEATCEIRVKYKELLMALLSVAVIEIYCGQYSQAQHLLIEAESLIRRRGLPKLNKSLKVRSLHHVYTYLRIMAESTCGCALVSVCPQRPGSSLLSIEASYQSLRSFRVADHTTTTDLVSTCEKTLDTGHNDIHLELMGEWKHTLFPEMYKVPESLMGLLSQTIRLANEQELLNRDTIVDFDIPTNLSQRTRLLEHQVLSWDKTHAYPTAPDVNPINEKGFRYDALATHQGLILFYYRRIHNINALILQDTVRKVLDFAQESANAGIENGFPSPLLLWPCFIAACEALEPGLQDRALKFLLDADCQSMAPSFSVAAEVAQKVWSLRRETQDYTIGWVQATAPYRCPIIAI